MLTVERAADHDIPRSGFRPIARRFAGTRTRGTRPHHHRGPCGGAYLSESSPTRQPAIYGVLRSLYAEGEHRNSTVGAQLTEAFIAWARRHGGAEALVDSYSANESAQRFDRRLGFQPRSVSLALRL